MTRSSKRRWVWLTLVALVVAALLWIGSEADDNVAPAPTAPATSRRPAAPTPTAAEDPAPPRPLEPADEPPGADAPPTAIPLPRDQVELPSSRSAPDGGVPERDPVSPAEQRDEMMRTIIDRLEEDLRAAEEAGDDERAAQLRVRIERLEARRRELAGP